MVQASVTVPGAEPFSAHGHGAHARTGVVVLHGFTGNPNSTRPLGQRLAAEGYRVEVPRLPGHGTTPRDLGQTRYEDWVSHAEAVMDQVRKGVDRVVMIGLSMGGTLTLDLASRRTDAIDAVVVINPQVLDPDQPLAKAAPVLQYLAPYVPRDLAGLPTDDIARPSADEHAYGLVPAKSAQSLIRSLPGVRAQLPQLTQPLLIAYAPQDHTVPAKNALALRDLVGSTDVTELELPRSYHVATLDYDAPVLEAAILDFVAKHG